MRVRDLLRGNLGQPFCHQAVLDQFGRRLRKLDVELAATIAADVLTGADVPNAAVRGDPQSGLER
jgi:hypothetical protein